MSHQDRKSAGPIVVNHESIKQAVNSLFAARGCRNGLLRVPGVEEVRVGDFRGMG